MNCGLYEIASPSGKRYVGSAVDVRRRWRRHKKDLRKVRHHSAALQRAWAKYGEESITFRIILVCAPDDLLMYEQAAIDALEPEYNVSRDAGSPMKGRMHSETTRVQMSTSHRGRKLSPEHIKASADGQRGIPKRKRTPEEKYNIAEKIRAWCAANPGARKSKRHSTVAKARISAGLERAYKEGRR